MFGHFLSLGASDSSWTRTPNLGMLRWVFYHCVITAGQCDPIDKGIISVFWYYYHNVLAIYSISVLVVVSGLKTLTLGLWSECFTTVLPPLVSVTQLTKVSLVFTEITTNTFCPFSISQCKQDSTHQPSDVQLIVLPLCYFCQPFLPLAGRACLVYF